MAVYRKDLGQLKTPTRLDDGRLSVEGLFTRSGVFLYQTIEGKVFREYRPESEVFNSDSMKSFALIPLTNDHPDEELTSKNMKEYSVGTTGENLDKMDIYLKGSIMIFDEKAINDVLNGKHELSCGYYCDMDFTPGITPEGEPYDAIQRNIRGNHLAIVERGRAGSFAQIRLDSNNIAIEVTKEKMQMDELEKLKKENQELKQRADKAEAERDAYKVKLEQEQKAHKDSIENIPAQTRARIQLENKAASILKDENLKLDSLSDKEIMVMVVKELDGEDVSVDSQGKSRSQDYITARFDVAISNHVEIHNETKEFLNATTRTDSKLKSAREQMIQKQLNAYKEKR